MRTRAIVGMVLVALLPPVGTALESEDPESTAFTFPMTGQTMRDATPAVLEASEVLNEYAWNHPHQFAGSVTSPEGDTLQVMVAEPDSAEAREAREIAEAYRGSVLFVEVEHSGAELEARRDELLAARSPAGTNILAVGLRPSANTISVAVDSASISGSSPDAQAVAVKALTSAELAAVSSLDNVVIIVEGPSESSGSRMKDSGSKSGGGAWNGNGRACSLGFPLIVYPSARYGATAGHCMLGSATAYAPGETTSTYRFGTTNTTSWPGNAYRYSDFRLLQGSTYSANIWVSSSATSEIRAAAWWSRSEDSQLCSSGRSTGQVCRYYITDVRAATTVSGVDVAPVTRMVHKSDRVNTDCSGWQQGDSGGPVYFSHSSGSGLHLSGMVTGSTSCQNGSRSFYASELNGISNWRYVGIPLANGTISWGP